MILLIPVIFISVVHGCRHPSLRYMMSSSIPLPQSSNYSILKAWRFAKFRGYSVKKFNSMQSCMSFQSALQKRQIDGGHVLEEDTELRIQDIQRNPVWVIDSSCIFELEWHRDWIDWISRVCRSTRRIIIRLTLGSTRRFM